MRRLVLAAFVLVGCLSPEAPPAPTVTVTHTGPELTDLALDAIEAAPLWLQADLTFTLRKLDSTLQDDIGASIVDLDDPYLTDEVAFAVARSAPEYLESSGFYPQLFVENAQLIYDRDPDLAYVQLDDIGEPGVDADYETTATYQVEIDKTQIERTLDRETYYWYLVHPRMEDEYPLYVDPWAYCGSSECASNPEDGSFWRDFLWEGAAESCPDDRDCPVIADYLTEAEVLWKGKSYNRDDNGAIGRLIQWEMDSMVFGAGDERPVQPNRIYAVGCGNCGEWADMATAAARTALIPSHNVGAFANDHTWNEFWDDGWQQWEPVNNYVLHWTYYVDGDGDYGRTYDSLDNDCDGVADEGLDEQPGSGSIDDTDADADGYSVLDGDCDDTNGDVNPGADESTENRYDDDCDGVAEVDDGSDADDDDGDGYSIEDGDCNDESSGVYPGKDDPPLSTNRLFAISAGRGDSRISSERTSDYGTEAYLRFTVSDEEGRAVDGAIVNVYGNWSVYGYPEYPAWATEGITGPDGVGIVHVGEANPYGYAVTSAAGNDPSPGYLYSDQVEWTEAGETYDFTVTVDGEMPDEREYTLIDLPNPAVVHWETVTLDLSITEGRVEADGSHRGTSRSNIDPVAVDVMIVDDDGWEDFEAGKTTDVYWIEEDITEASTTVDLPMGRDWHVVTTIDGQIASYAIGSLSVTTSGGSEAYEVWIGPDEATRVTLSP